MKSIETSIACPKCKKSMSVPPAEVKAGYTKLCRNCGAQIELSGKVENVIHQLNAPGPVVNVKVKVKSRRPWWRFWS